MSWTLPRSWTNSETVTDEIMNAHVRDNFVVLGAKAKVTGAMGTCADAFAYSGSQTATNSNAVGGGDTELTGYRITLPAAYLKQGGDALRVRGLLYQPTAAVASFKLSLGGGTATTLITTTAAAQDVPFFFRLEWRSNSVVAYHGRYWGGAVHAGAPALSYASGVLSGTYDCSTECIVKVYLAAAAANTVTLKDYANGSFRPKDGDGALV